MFDSVYPAGRPFSSPALFEAVHLDKIMDFDFTHIHVSAFAVL